MNGKPKEIEELFELQQKLYQPQQNINSNLVADRSINLSVQQQNNRIYKNQENEQQNYTQNQILSDKTTMLNMRKQATQTLSQKKQGQTGRIEKKLCNDDDTQAYNTRITYDQQQQHQYQNLKEQLNMNQISPGNSSNSALSDSPNIASSLQKHASENQKSSKVLNPFNSNSDYQTIQSALSSVQSKQTNNINRNAINISQSLNQRALTGLQNVINQANVAVKDLKNNLSESKKPITRQTQMQMTSLESVRYQQKLQKNQENNIHLQSLLKSTQLNNQPNLRNQKQQQVQVPMPQKSGQLSQKLHSAIKTQQLNLSNQKYNQSMPRQTSTNKHTPHAKISLTLIPKQYQNTMVQAQDFNLTHSQVPKIQDKPQAKKINDESEEETIDSQDMSSSLIQNQLSDEKRFSYEKVQQKQNLNKKQKNTKNLQQPRIEEPKIQLESQESNRELFSFNEGLLKSQQSHIMSLAQMQTIDNRFGDSSTGRVGTKSSIAADPLNLINALQNAAYRSTSSANKRARWDLSGGRSTLHNSFRKNSDSDLNNNNNNNNIKNNNRKGGALLKVKKESEQKKNSDNNNQNQYEQLQQQYLAIKQQLKEMKLLQQNTQKQNSIQKSTKKVDETEKENILSASSYSQDADDDSFDMNRTNYKNKKDKSKTKVDHNLTTTKSNVRKKKSGNHFKSLDVQFLPQILKTSLKQEQSPQVNNYISNTNQTDRKECRFQDCDLQTVTKLKKKLAYDIQNIERLQNDELNAVCQSYNLPKQQQHGNALKSQLQIGLRKLSENRQILEDLENTLQRKYQDNAYKVNQTAQQVQSHQKKQSKFYQHARNLSKDYYMKQHKRQTSKHSQVSFVGVDSYISSDEFKDCKSYTDKNSRITSKQKLIQKKKSIASSTSSQYYLAQNNLSESDCSCCKEENSKSIRKSSKRDHRSKQSITIKENHHRKSKNREQSRDQYDHSKYQELSEQRKVHRSQTQKERQNTYEKEEKTRTNKQEKQRVIDEAKPSQKNTKKKSSRRVTTHQDDNTIMTNRSQSKQNKKHVTHKSSMKNTEQTPQSTYRSKKQSSTTLNVINPWMSQTLKPAYDLAGLNILQQQLALAQQLQTPVFQQTQVLQPMLMTGGQASLLGLPHMLNSTTQFQPNQTIVNSMPITKLNSPTAGSNAAILSRTIQKQNTGSIMNQKQQLLLQQNPIDNLRSLEEHQEQIEAIELLIKEAKTKLENNILNNQNPSCRLIESNMSMSQRSTTRNQTRAITQSIKEEIEMKSKKLSQFKGTSRNDNTNIKATSSYNSNLEGSSQQNHLLFRTQNSQNSNNLQRGCIDNNYDFQSISKNAYKHKQGLNFNDLDDQYEEINHYQPGNYNKTDIKLNNNKRYTQQQFDLQGPSQDFNFSYRKASNISNINLDSRFQSNSNREHQKYQEQQQQIQIDDQQQSKTQRYQHHINNNNNNDINDHNNYSSQKRQQVQRNNQKQLQKCQEDQKEQQIVQKPQKKIQKQESDNLESSLMFNQSISSLGLYNRKQSNAESNQGYQSNKNILANKEGSSQELLWIDFNDNKSADIQKRQDLKKQRLQQNQKQNKLGQENYPQSIPEENDDFHSPEFMYDKQKGKKQEKNQKTIKIPIRLDIPSTNTQSTESLQMIHTKRNQINNTKDKQQKRQQIIEVNLDDTQKTQVQDKQQQKQPQKNDGAWVMDFTDKPSSPSQKQQADSIAEAFKNRMLNMEKKFKKTDDEQTIKNNNNDEINKTKKEFTKEELLQRKKELLKQAREKLQKNLHQKQEQQEDSQNQQQFDQSKQPLENKDGQQTSSNTRQQQQQKPNSKSTTRQQQQQDNVPTQLLTRLSQGQKTEITKKDMLKLTSKNYEQLPEIKQKKIDSSKKDDLLKRIANVKDMEKKRRQTVVQKQMQKQQQLSSKLPPSGKQQ